MALSEKAKIAIRVALADTDKADELIAEIAKIDSAGAVAALGTTSDLTASAAGLSTGDTYTDAAVNAGIDTVLDITIGEVEARLDDIEAKVDEILAALG